MCLSGHILSANKKVINIMLNYTGPLHENISSWDVNIDITGGEIMEYAIEKRKMFITYFDLFEESSQIIGYGSPVFMFIGVRIVT